MSLEVMRSGYVHDGQPVPIEELEAARRLRDVLKEFGCSLPLDKSLEAHRQLCKPPPLVVDDPDDGDDEDDDDDL